MQTYEILGSFYLGKTIDPETMNRTNQYFLYDSKDLMTHALCVGMTGSGKTALGIGILEEAIIDNIPALIIDPKGDMTNLLLTFPELRPSDFLPWLHASDAKREGLSLEEYAEIKAETWRQGLSNWEQDGQRIQDMRSKGDFSIYTPGSSAGKSLSIVRMLDCPAKEILQDHEALQDYIGSTISALLSLLGIDADPLQSREHVLLSNVLLNYWQEGQSLDLARLIELITSPGIEKVGIMPLETFYPKNDRMQLAMCFNNLLASPLFSSWLEGEALNVQNLLYTNEGKPRVSVLSLNHLGDQERIFFVSTFLNQVLAWVRTQAGTPSLRALLYMDEIFGYFPPTANPPTKKPLLTLLKQARAYGLGIVLATQNPVDLDYKGLSNIGTWFVGRLQTEQDKARLLDGLQTAAKSSGEFSLDFDRKELSNLLSVLPARAFLVKNVHDQGPLLFETRWCMSYLAGPLTKQQISALTAQEHMTSLSTSEEEPQSIVQAESQNLEAKKEITSVGKMETLTSFNLPPKTPKGIAQYYLPLAQQSSNIVYLPSLYAYIETTFESQRYDIFTSQSTIWNTLLEDSVIIVDWQKKTGASPQPDELENTASTKAKYLKLPDNADNKTIFNQWEKELVDHLFRNQMHTIFTNDNKTIISKDNESEADFKIRLRQATREERDKELAKLRNKYNQKFTTLAERIRKAEQAVERERSQAEHAKFSTVINIGNTLLDAFLGHKGLKKSTVSKASSSARSAGRAKQQKSDVARAEETVLTYQQNLKELELELEEELQNLTDFYIAKEDEVNEVKIKAKKKNIIVKVFSLLWLPYEKKKNNKYKPLFYQNLEKL